MNRTRRVALAMLAGVGLVTAGLPTAVSSAAPPQVDLKAQVAEALGVPASQLAAGERRSAVGLTHVRFQQVVDGVPVLGAQGVATLGPDDEVLAVSGRVEQDAAVTASAGRSRVSTTDARSAAVKQARKVEDLPAGKVSVESTRAVLVDQGLLKGKPTGTLRRGLEFTMTEPGGASGTVTVDAFTGDVLNTAFAKARLNRDVCDQNNQFGMPNCEHDAAVRSEGGPESSIKDVNEAYDQLGLASGWFAEALGVDLTDKLGVDRGDGNGKALRALTRICFYSCPDGGYWSKTNSQVNLGEGFAVDDVIGHELGHGVSYSHGIDYAGAGENGAIHEHMSDVFGELFDQATPTGKDDPSVDWRIGEDVEHIYGQRLRDMKNPSSLGHPETMSEYSPSNTSHIGAGVGNKTAYLIAAGDTFNGQKVKGIGNAKTAKLFYAVNSAMTTVPTYQEEGRLLNEQCQALVTTRALNPSDCKNVQKATNATGLTATPTKGNSGKPLVTQP